MWKMSRMLNTWAWYRLVFVSIIGIFIVINIEHFEMTVETALRCNCVQTTMISYSSISNIINFLIKINYIEIANDYQTTIEMIEHSSTMIHYVGWFLWLALRPQLTTGNWQLAPPTFIAIIYCHISSISTITQSRIIFASFQSLSICMISRSIQCNRPSSIIFL